MKNFVRLYILISAVVLCFSICVILSNWGGLISKTKADSWFLGEFMGITTQAEYYKTSMREAYKDNIVYSCVYGGYIALSFVFGCFVLAQYRKK